MKIKFAKLILNVILILIVSTAISQEIKLEVDVDNQGTEIQPTMWGLFFEDINFAADGGLYAELIKNRSFEFPNPKMGWETPGQNFFNSSLLFINRGEEYNNVRYAQMKVNDSNPAIENAGFRGIGVKEGEEYRFSIWASLPDNDNISLNIELINSSENPIGKVKLSPEGKEWKKYEVLFTAEQTDPKSKLKITFEGEGTIDFDMVSLFPVKTWMNRKNGLRADLVQILADMNPGFFRFPGGCIVEGRDLAKRYQWKQTVGNIEDRKLNINRWNDENTQLTPDYFQTYGLGFYEYFLLSEDLGAEPLPVVNCGMACQFNTGEVVPLDQMDQYIQDALDLIEFANGSTDSKWGKLRAEMGHPESFNMKYIGIGNEQWGEQYFERYALFEKVLLEKFPEIKIISTSGPLDSGPFFDFAEKELEKYNAALVDEHYYKSPEWFFENATRYDDYNRDSYKIFLGEFAAASHQMASPENKNTWECALAEAAYMTGLERNADVVNMVSYAPLLAHVDAWQWTPDLIWFDNLSSYGTPSYYVQKLYGTNRGTNLLTITQNDEPLTGNDGLYGTAAYDKNNNEVILKLVNNSEKGAPVNINLNSKKRFLSDADLIYLSSSDLEEMNSIEEPENIAPSMAQVKLKGKNLIMELAPYSFSVVKIKTK